MEGAGEGILRPEYTPTWIIAAVCFAIVLICIVIERAIHFIGRYLKRKKLKSLFEALQKLKEELMLLGFISLLLSVFQNMIVHLCIPRKLTHKFLPCNQGEERTNEHVQVSFRRSLLSKEKDEFQCREDKVPLLSVEALHDLHIFIFVLATVHVISTVLTMILAVAKTRKWQHWEKSISEGKYEPDKVLEKMEIQVEDHAFFRGNFLYGKKPAILGWMSAFTKQFYHSVTKSDYITLRHGFVMAHLRGNQKFDFYTYMIRSLEDDFEQVVGIRWYLWIFVFIFLVLNVAGWHTYFWLSFIPLILLFVVGTKLEHVIVKLASEVATSNRRVEEPVLVKPKDDHFWFHRPPIVLNLIHFILFQNAFEIAFFFWIWIKFGFHCCIMGQIYFIIPRLVIGVIVQLMCSYSTLPLYAIVTQMGSSYKSAIFSRRVRKRISQWQKIALSKERIEDALSKEKRDTSIEVHFENISDEKENRDTSIEVQFENISDEKENRDTSIEVQSENISDEKENRDTSIEVLSENISDEKENRDTSIEVQSENISDDKENRDTSFEVLSENISDKVFTNEQQTTKLA